MNEDIQFEIVKHLGVLKEFDTGWRKELNLVKWNDNSKPVFDIRDWNGDEHTMMSRGITLNDKEAHRLFISLGDFFYAYSLRSEV